MIGLLKKNHQIVTFLNEPINEKIFEIALKLVKKVLKSSKICSKMSEGEGEEI